MRGDLGERDGRADLDPLRVGLRKVIDEEAVKKVVKYLTSGGTEMFSMMNFGISMPTGASSSLSAPASLVPIAS